VLRLTPLRDRLVDLNEQKDGNGRLTRSVVFSSPSTAGAVALGRSCNGRREWFSAQGTFGDRESRGRGVE